MNHIITPEEVKEHGRAMSTHIDKKTLEALITEVETLDIMPTLGVALMTELSESIAEGTLNEHETLLLNGGYYDNRTNYLRGLRTACAYYVQARLVKTNDNQITRFGMMQKDSEYGYRPTLAERTDTYNEICAIADQYLQEVVDYLRQHQEIFPSYGYGRIQNNRTIYRIIGD